jgi:hypothetical protein
MLALASQGAKLAEVTTRLHTAETKLHQAENEVRDLKRSDSSHPEDHTPVVKNSAWRRLSGRSVNSRKSTESLRGELLPSRSSPVRRERGEAWLQQVPPEE